MNEQEALERWKKEEGFRDYWKEYRQLEGFSKSLLYTLEITHKCFLKCRHCFAEASPDNGDFLEAELVDKLVEDSIPIFQKNHHGGVRITGGDAFLHPDLDSIVRSFSSRREKLGCLIDVETSGGWASNGCVEERVERLKQAGANCISMTNDYWHSVQNVFPNAEYGERIRKACENVGFKFRYITVPLPVVGSIKVSDVGGQKILDFIPTSVPIGRARELPEEYWTDFCGDSNECKLVPDSYDKNITFDPKGNVYLCYSGKCFSHASLAVGNLHKKSIVDILGEESNPVVRLLSESGIRGLTELVGLTLVQHYTLLDKMGPCGLCHEVLRNYGQQITSRLEANA